MTSPSSPPRFAALFAGRMVLVAVCAALFVLVVQLALRSDTMIIESSMLDDGAYFAKLARNLVSGHGYALDGIHVTNGVQPFWAGIVVVLAALLPNDVDLLRAMMVVGAGGWLLGALLLARLLRECGSVAAVTAAIGFALAGIEAKRSFSGMENGVHGALVVGTLLLAEAVRRGEPGSPRQRRLTWWFGVTAAAMALNRVEYGLLVAMLGGQWAWVLLRAQGAAVAWRTLLPFLLPLIAGGLCWAIPSYLCTGAVLPVSGSVKAFVNQKAEQNAIAAGTAVAFGDRFWQLAHQFGSHAVRPQMLGCYLTVEAAFRQLQFGIEAYGRAAWVTLVTLYGGLLLGLLQLVRASTTERPRAVRLLFVAFAVIHVALFARFLGYHSAYSSWHSVGEITAIWLLIGHALGALRSWWRLLQLPLAVTIVVLPLHWCWPGWWRGMADPEMQSFTPLVRCGYWLERWLPQPSRVAAFNTGLMAYVADSHRVTNVDGLVNTPAYLRDYLRHERVGDYLQAERIEYFADQFLLADWSNGESERLLGPRRRLLWYQRSLPDRAVCIFELRPGPAPIHPLAEPLFKAQFLQQLPIVPHAALPQLPTEQRVVASFLIPPSEQLHHVVMPRADAARAVVVDARSAVTPLTVPPQLGVAPFAIDLPLAPTLAGTVVELTVFCRLTEVLDGPREVLVRCADGAVSTEPGLGVLQVMSPLAYGTVGAGDGPDSGVIAHFVAFRVPLDHAEAELPLRLGIRKPGAEWQLVDVGVLRIAR